jgi:6-carboxyhexanoate--CoA ligase
MRNLVSIRMRASKKVGSRRYEVDRQKEIHISGAEGLYEPSEIQKITIKYIERALNHPKGSADKIVVTVEEIKKRPRTIPALPLATVVCRGPNEGEKIISKILRSSGISAKAVRTALSVMKKGSMRGAAIVSSEKGNRLEPDSERGVRVSCLGIDPSARRILSLRLSRRGINTDTVKEALMLASKAISCRGVIAELCISDDPDYTTGYVASREFGYLRIPHIKPEKSKTGGRAFFVMEDSNVQEIIEYLERVPVLIGKIDSCRGALSIDEIINCSHQ